jgi:hypothetical protein
VQPGDVAWIRFETEAVPDSFELKVDVESREAGEVLVLPAQVLLERAGAARH